ncbi:putative succinate-semialdehyde dehydrogenase (NAD(+)) [Helianthus anomalus]
MQTTSKRSYCGGAAYAARFIELFAEEAKRVYGDIIPSPLPNRCLFPVGVVGAITPWNFPTAMIARKVGPALACGCTMVVMPSALACSCLLLHGVLNVVMGDPPSIGDSLLESTQVRKITFTGSTIVGKKLMCGPSETVKKVVVVKLMFYAAIFSFVTKRGNFCQLNSITLDNNVYAQIEYLCKKVCISEL